MKERKRKMEEGETERDKERQTDRQSKKGNTYRWPGKDKYRDRDREGKHVWRIWEG